jgi:hypothetical protein
VLVRVVLLEPRLVLVGMRVRGFPVTVLVLVADVLVVVAGVSVRVRLPTVTVLVGVLSASGEEPAKGLEDAGHGSPLVGTGRAGKSGWMHSARRKS